MYWVELWRVKITHVERIRGLGHYFSVYGTWLVGIFVLLNLSVFFVYIILFSEYLRDRFYVVCWIFSKSAS